MLPHLLSALLASSTVAPDGSELLQACTSAQALSERQELTDDEEKQAAYCVGYVSGVVDGLVATEWKGGSSKVCLPKDGVSNDQAIRLVVKYLRAHPERLHETARATVVVAIADAFRC